MCGHYTSGASCGSVIGVRHYLPGWRCPSHTPAAVAGQPEPSGAYCAPTRCYCGRPVCPAYVTYIRTRTAA